MNTNTQQPVPDYGEPWKIEAYNSPLGESGDFEGVIEIRTRDEIRRAEAYNPDDEDEDAFERIVSCVNACAGMADPAKEIQAMREELADIRQRLKGHPDSKLDGENGLAAATMRGFDGFQVENEAMRTAIKEAYNSFADEPASDSVWLLNDRQTAALANLKPFLKPFLKP